MPPTTAITSTVVARSLRVAARAVDDVVRRARNGLDAALRVTDERLTAYYGSAVKLVLRQLEGSLHASAAARTSTLPGVMGDTEVRFALDELGSRRIDAAIEYLRTDELDRLDQLVRFVNVLRLLTRERVEAAEDSAAVADALGETFDDLHRFLLAHDLVDARYRSAQAVEPEPRPRWTGRPAMRPHTAGPWRIPAHGPGSRGSAARSTHAVHA